MRVVLLAGCLLVAGGAGTGTASGHEPTSPRTAAPPVRSFAGSEPEFPGPDPRVVEPDRRPPGAMPQVVPRGPRAVPMPQLQHRPRSRPVPMPELDQHDGELVIPPRGLLRPRGPVLPGELQLPGD